MMNGKDILTQFRAAGKLVNEWRDTLSAAALGTAVCTGLVSPDATIPILLVRESSRALSWLLDRSPIYVGSKKPVNNYQMTAASNTAGFLGVLAHGMLTGNMAFVALGAGGVPVALALAGGPRAVCAAYRDVMWDYPRKKDDGGTTQTQKLKDGSKELIQDLVDQVAPAPTPVPVPVRSRATAPSASRPSFSARFKN